MITVILIINMPKRHRNQSQSNGEYFEVAALRRKLHGGCGIEEDAANPYYEALWIEHELRGEGEVVITDIKVLG